MSSNHLNLYRPLLLLPSILPSIRVFSNESVLCIKWLIICHFAKTNTAKTVKRERQGKCELHWCKWYLFFLDYISWLKLFWSKKKKKKDKYVGCLGQLKKGTLVSVQFSSVAQSCPTFCDPTNHSTPALPVHHCSRSLPKLISIDSVMPSNRLILCPPLLLLPSIFPSIRVFSNESVLCIRWSNYWSFSFNISPSNEYSGLISFRMDWLDLLAVQGTLKSLLQHHSSKASILQRSALFIVQLSYPYMTTGKSIALTRCILLTK